MPRLNSVVTSLHNLRRVNADSLIILVVVAETGSISQAAELMGFSQSAISQQLKALSIAVGERLHERSSHGTGLTFAGQRLALEAAPLLRGYRAVLEYLASLESGDAGIVSIAASNTVAAHVLPGWLIAYRHRYQGVRLRARSANSEAVLEALRLEEVEIALIETPTPYDRSGLDVVDVGGDELVLVCSPRLRSFASSSVAWSEISDLPMVWRELGSGVRATVELAMQRCGYHVDQLFELAGSEAVKEAIVAGLGVGFLSSLATTRELEEGLLVRLELEDLGSLPRRFSLVSVQPELLSVPARNFRDLVERSLEAVGG
jgi:DNA-binding transcriptional LysR family regulator